MRRGRLLRPPLARQRRHASDGNGERPREAASPRTAMTPLCPAASTEPDCVKEKIPLLKKKKKKLKYFRKEKFDYRKYWTPKRCRPRKEPAPTLCGSKPPANGLCREAIGHGFQKALHSGFYKGKYMGFNHMTVYEHEQMQNIICLGIDAVLHKTDSINK
jgi:hypothetical protein